MPFKDKNKMREYLKAYRRSPKNRLYEQKKTVKANVLYFIKRKTFLTPSQRYPEKYPNSPVGLNYGLVFQAFIRAIPIKDFPLTQSEANIFVRGIYEKNPNFRSYETSSISLTTAVFSSLPSASRLLPMRNPRHLPIEDNNLLLEKEFMLGK